MTFAAAVLFSWTLGTGFAAEAKLPFVRNETLSCEKLLPKEFLSKHVPGIKHLFPKYEGYVMNCPAGKTKEGHNVVFSFDCASNTKPERLAKKKAKAEKNKEFLPGIGRYAESFGKGVQAYDDDTACVVIFDQVMEPYDPIKVMKALLQQTTPASLK